MNRIGALIIVAVLMSATLACSLSVLTGDARAWDAEAFSIHPTSGYPNQSVAFSMELTNTGENTMAITKAGYVIDWGEKTTSVTLKGNFSVEAGETTNLTGTFVTPDVSPGTYSGNVTITARAGLLELIPTPKDYPADFTIVPVPPLTVSVLASPASGTVPLTVNFSSTVEGGVGPYSYAWSAGDGSSGNSSSFEHQYAQPGKYAATLVVTDSRGAKASSNLTINAGASRLVASIQATALNGLSPLTTKLTSDVSGGVGPYTYSWTTGDGGTFDVKSFTYEYYEPGTYTVRLLVTDAEGSTARDLVTVAVLSSTDQTVVPDAGGPLDIGGMLVIYIFVFAVASVTVVGFMVYRNRTRFRR